MQKNRNGYCLLLGENYYSLKIAVPWERLSN